MEAFVKSIATYRTLKKATVISSALTLDSLEADTSTVTVEGTAIGRSDTGNWLIVEGNLFLISQVKPQEGRTLLTLLSPLDAFSRPLEPAEQPEGQTIGGFVRSMLESNWLSCDDAAYAMPYLLVSNSDTTAYREPELENNGCFSLADYCRLMRKLYRVKVRFFDAGDALGCSISRIPPASRQVSFDDGHSQLQSVDYSRSGIAKLTVLHTVDTGETDENGEKITTTERTVWYLSEDGAVSQSIPARRASGEWSAIAISGNADPEEKAAETFAKNKANHKLEFWSSRDLAVQDDCTFFVYGELLHSYISYKRKSSADSRFYYKSGELATTATEKLRGAMK